MPWWLGELATYGWWVAGVSLLAFAGTLILIPVLVVRMPSDYFARPSPPPESWRRRHPAIRITVLLLKNLFGLALVTAGLIMLFTPGQGILAIVAGLSFLDVPGKRTLERRIVANPRMLRAINSLRARAGRPPLQLP
jgi:hypothetical protein